MSLIARKTPLPNNLSISKKEDEKLAQEQAQKQKQM